MTERPEDPTQPIAADATAERPAVDAAVPAVDAAAPAVAAAQPTRTWRSRVSSRRGLAVAALIVGLGLGAVGGSAVTVAATHDNGSGGFHRDGHAGPGEGRGGPPPAGRMPGGGQQQGGGGGATGQRPGGGIGTDGSTGGPGVGGWGEDSTDANGTSQAT